MSPKRSARAESSESNVSSVPPSPSTANIQAPRNNHMTAVSPASFANLSSSPSDGSTRATRSSDPDFPSSSNNSNIQASANALFGSNNHTSAISHLLTYYNIIPELVNSTTFMNNSSDDNFTDDLKVVPVVTNIVCTANVGCELDLDKIAKCARNAEFNKKHFLSVVMKIREPKATALVHSNGKLVCLGTRSETMAIIATRRFARIIQQLGFKARFLNFEIHNVVGSCKVNFPIRIEALARAHPQLSSYDPEIFSGLIYKMISPRVNFLIFSSGKISMAGTKSKEELDEAFEALYPILLGFKNL